jgi:hypothetical protein
MPNACISRVAAGAMISASLTVGSLTLTATAASACTASPNCGGGPPPAAAPARARTGPDCIKGAPPAAVSALEGTDPRCISGTQPAAARWPGNLVAGRAGQGGPASRTAGQVSTATSAVPVHAGTAVSVNCPPPSISDPGSGGC